MVLGSFQCRGALLLLHIVRQGPAVLAAGAGWVGYIYIYIFFFFHPSSLSNVLSFGRPLNMTERLWFRLLNPYGSCQLPRLVLVNCLEGLSLPRNSATINWLAQHDLIVDWAVKLQHKQTNKIISNTSAPQHLIFPEKQKSIPKFLDIKFCFSKLTYKHFPCMV